MTNPVRTSRMNHRKPLASLTARNAAIARAQAVRISQTSPLMHRTHPLRALVA